jgi:uncharacterized DUF497 family protein
MGSFKSRDQFQKTFVSFSEAVTVFNDEQGITIFDPDNSESEDRFILFGLSEEDRYLMVVHADRHDMIRIISAREMTHNERKSYEKEILRRNGL